MRTEDESIIEVIKAARMVQEFLWGGIDEDSKIEKIKEDIWKRITKIEEINTCDPHWKVELRKRLLQLAAISVHILTRLDNDKIKKEAENE